MAIRNPISYPYLLPTRAQTTLETAPCKILSPSQVLHLFLSCAAWLVRGVRVPCARASLTASIQSHCLAGFEIISWKAAFAICLQYQWNKAATVSKSQEGGLGRHVKRPAAHDCLLQSCASCDLSPIVSLPESNHSLRAD